MSRPLRTGLTYAAPPALRSDGGEAQSQTSIDGSPSSRKAGANGVWKTTRFARR